MSNLILFRIYASLVYLSSDFIYLERLNLFIQIHIMSTCSLISVGRDFTFGSVSCSNLTFLQTSVEYLSIISHTSSLMSSKIVIRIKVTTYYMQHIYYFFKFDIIYMEENDRFYFADKFKGDWIPSVYCSRTQLMGNRGDLITLIEFEP